MTTVHSTNSISPATAGRGFLLVALASAWFALSLAPKAFGVSPAPDGGYPNFNTAEGTNALFSLTSGADNTAIGFDALLNDTTGFSNTATGALALLSNTAGHENTATGVNALTSNKTGNDNTATGDGALQSNTTGDDNTATGWQTLYSNTTGEGNTANGRNALFSNTIGSANTANGIAALYSNTSGKDNTATGVAALLGNTTGADNTATGADALFENTTGSSNTANGDFALYQNTTGNFNTANGVSALLNNTTGSGNTATGYQALYNALGSLTSGNNNTAEGLNALFNNTTGSNNIALGARAGSKLTNGSNNIDIGALGVAGESGKIRIGKVGAQNATFVAGIYGSTVASGVGVIVNSNGKLGTVQSSERFKKAIKPMNKASEAILSLKPVTFRYKPELDPDGIPQFGLVAEQVEKVNADLVARDAGGKVNTVRYEAVNAMLLNEFLKEHRKVEEQDRRLEKQEATITQLKKGMETVVAHLKEQELKIHKVNAQLELTKPASQVVLNNH